MIRHLAALFGTGVLLIAGLGGSLLLSPQTAEAGHICGHERYLLGIPSWDRGLEDCSAIESSELLEDNKSNPIYIILTNIMIILLHLAGMIAVGFVIYGGLQYILSTGNPDQAGGARKTITNALIGLAIAIMGRVVAEGIYNSLTGGQVGQGIPQTPAEDLLGGTLNVVFLVIGAISLIVLTLQGIKYSLSGGDPQNTASARNGIIYALVGLAISTTAWSLVNFTIERVIQNDAPAEAETIAVTLVNVAGFIVLLGGIIASIMVLIGAIRYALSMGKSENLEKAKNTIIYALIGLLITIVAGPIISIILSRL